MNAGLSKMERICSVNAIEQLVSHGRYVTDGHLRCCYLPNGLEYGRMMVSVPKKFFKRAVKRNLLKRRVREAYRLNKQIVDCGVNVDVMFVYTSKEVDDFATVSESVKRLLSTINSRVAAKLSPASESDADATSAQ